MIITISREYGSGGGEIAHKLAEVLGIPCYDKTVAQLTASISGFSKECIDEAEDKVTGIFQYFGGVYNSGNLPIYDRIYLKQREAIIQLAKRGDCVIVGRCAAHILEEEGMPALNVFVYAPMPDRIKRIAEKFGISDKEAEKAIRKKDSFRRNYYKRYAYADWGAREYYHMLINSTIGIDKAVKIIVDLDENAKTSEKTQKVEE